jgi:DHA2 family multidrug resistance protein
MPQNAEWKILLVSISGTFMVILDQTIMNIALPHIMAVFNETTDRAQLVISAYMMATAVTTPAAAYLCTRFGLKRVFILSQVGFLLGSVLCGMAWNSYTLILFRIIQGLAGGLLSPIAMTLLFIKIPPQDRGTAMGIFGIPMMLGPAIGPTLGGYLVDYWDWRWCFYVNVPVVLAAIFIGMAWIEEMSTSPARFDLLGFTLAATGFSSILYGLSYAPSWGWDDLRIIGLLAVGSVSLVTWITMELRSDHPMLDLRIFKYRGFSLSMGLTFITTIGLFSAIFLLPVFLQNVRGMSAMNTGLMVLPTAIGAMITMPISGRFYDRIGPRLPAIAGLIITGLTTLWMQWLDVTTSDDTLRWILFLRGMGLGFAMMPIMTFGMASVPQEKTAQASSVMNVWRTVFASLGIAIFATLLDTFQKTNVNIMSQTLTPDSALAMRVISTVQVTLMQSGQTLETARAAGVSLLYQYVNLRAIVTAFQMDFVLASLVILVGVPPAFLLPFGRSRKPGAPHGVEMG